MRIGSGSQGEVFRHLGGAPGKDAGDIVVRTVTGAQYRVPTTAAVWTDVGLIISLDGVPVDHELPDIPGQVFIPAGNVAEIRDAPAEPEPAEPEHQAAEPEHQAESVWQR
jgi:hypothetical protein